MPKVSRKGFLKGVLNATTPSDSVEAVELMAAFINEKLIYTS